MKLVENEEQSSIEKVADNMREKPVVDLPATAQSKIPAGMIEGLKNIRHEVASIHGYFTQEHGMAPSFLSGAYTAIEDAETFLKNVANGKEEFSPVPAKPVMKSENVTIVDGIVKAPSNLKDIPYVQEWSSSFFFPTLRQLISRTDVEVEIRGEMTKKKVAQIAIAVTTSTGTVVLDTKFKANDSINMMELVEAIKAV